MFRRPRPAVKVEMPDGRTIDGTAVEWLMNGQSSVVAVHTGKGTMQFGLVTGRIAGLEEHPMKPCIRADSLVALRANIASRENAPEEALVRRSAFVLVSSDDHAGAIAVSGDEQVLHLLVPAGYAASTIAAQLEGVFAWAEHLARQGAERKATASAARKTSAARRKTTRTHRRGRDD
jgi:hypothetical protein